MPRNWDNSIASPAERAKHIKLAAENDDADTSCDADMPWIETEVLHAEEGTVTKLPGKKQFFSFSPALGMVMYGTLLGSMTVASLQVATSGFRALHVASKRKHALPI